MTVKNIVLMRLNGTQDKRDNYVTLPLGLGYIAAVLKKEGYKVSIVDLTLEDVNYDNVIERLRNIGPDLVGITALSYEYIQVKKMASLLNKNIQCKIVLGGHLPLYNYKLVLEKTNVDICVIGEGELTIVDLLNNISSLEKVKGIAYKENEQVKLNEARELINDLDTIPFPAYELFEMEKYSTLLMNDIYLSKKFLPKKRTHKKTSMEAGRGCPFSCEFCSKMFKKGRRRSI